MVKIAMKIKFEEGENICELIFAKKAEIGILANGWIQWYLKRSTRLFFNF